MLTQHQAYRPSNRRNISILPPLAVRMKVTNDSYGTATAPRAVQLHTTTPHLQCPLPMTPLSRVSLELLYALSPTNPLHGTCHPSHSILRRAHARVSLKQNLTSETTVCVCPCICLFPSPLAVWFDTRRYSVLYHTVRVSVTWRVSRCDKQDRRDTKVSCHVMSCHIMESEVTSWPAHTRACGTNFPGSWQLGWA